MNEKITLGLYLINKGYSLKSSASMAKLKPKQLYDALEKKSGIFRFYRPGEGGNQT